MKFETLLVPDSLALDHRNKGGVGLRRKVAYLPRGEVLRVMAGVEPCGENYEMILHISVSVARSPEVDEHPCRKVTDAEFKEAIESEGQGRWKEFATKTLVRHAFFG